jgi:hypothetical protein
VLVGVVAVATLSAAAPMLHWTRLHISGLSDALNDQVGYISVARNFVEHGELRSSIIYPATLRQGKTRNYLHMPGQYWALAAAYRVCGFGVLPSLLPSLLAFVLAAVALWLAGRTLYDAETGLLAALFFVVFPANVVFALTAMAELPLIGACVVAFTGFLFVSPRWRPYAGALLLVIPFLFRETAALLVIPMAALALRDGGRWGYGRAALLLIASVVVLASVYRSEMSAQRPGLNTYQIDDAHSLAKYDDATVAAAPASGKDWLAAAAANTVVNGRRLFATLASSPLERISLVIIAVGTLLVMAYGVGQARRDPLPLACGVLALVGFAFVFALYAIDRYRGVRTLLCTYPFIALGLARLLRERGRLPALLLLAVLAFAGAKTIAAVGDDYLRTDDADDAAADLMRAVGHDDSRLLVAPFWIALPYVYEHHPVRWSFVPGNLPTLQLLAARYEIGTVVLPHDGASTLGADDLQRFGLEPQGKFGYEGDEFLVFKQR